MNKSYKSFFERLEKRFEPSYLQRDLMIFLLELILLKKNSLILIKQFYHTNLIVFSLLIRSLYDTS